MAMYTGKSYFCDFMSLLIITKEDALGNLPMVKVGQEWIEIQCQLRLLCSVFPNYVYYLFFTFICILQSASYTVHCVPLYSY